MFFGHELYTNLERAKDVRIYRQDTLAIKKIEELEEWGNAEKKNSFYMSFFPAAAGFIVGLGNCACYLFVAIKAFLGAYGVGSVVQYISVLTRLGDGIRDFMFMVSDNELYCTHLKKMYDYLDENPELMSAPVSYTNDIRTIAAIDNFVSINNAVDVDLYGQVNGETAGTKQISGAGGQQDFVLGAYLSKGGKSFICCSSTFKKKDGTLESRIRPTLENGSVVTDARPCAHWFVTEYGKVNLKGLTAWQRAEALISVAHPDFREQLIQEAEKMRIWKRSNKR